MKGGPASLVPIWRTIKLQLNELTDDLVYKVLGILGFIFVLWIPYHFVESYWWLVEAISSDLTWRSFLSIYLWSCFMMFGLYIFFGVLYWLNHPAIEKYKDNDVPWPWQNEENWKPKIVKAIWVSIFNHFGLSGTLGLIGVYLGALNYRVLLEDIPTFPVFVCQVVFLIMVEDTMFFWSHRMLHQPWIYPYIHKMHHEFYNSIIFSCAYAHPIEHIFANSLPSLVGSKLLFGKCHVLTMLVFLTLRLTETAEAHSGYDFPFSLTKHLPLTCTQHYHNHHHLTNIGNYGSFFMLWDSICGTNTHFYSDKVNYQRSIEDRQHKEQ
jgi:sterol desaturase/sphingolipid hydroxylase (fatty acid hydroxylase superfamily)